MKYSFNYFGINILVTMQDSIETAVAIELFQNIKISTYFHLNYCSLEKIKMSVFENVINFNPNRLQKTASLAYPIDDRLISKVSIIMYL